MKAMGRTEDENDESIASSKLTENSAIKGMGKIFKISPVSLHVSLSDCDEEQKFLS